MRFKLSYFTVLLNETKRTDITFKITLATLNHIAQSNNWYACNLEQIHWTFNLGSKEEPVYPNYKFTQGFWRENPEWPLDWNLIMSLSLFAVTYFLVSVRGLQLWQKNESNGDFQLDDNIPCLHSKNFINTVLA